MMPSLLDLPKEILIFVIKELDTVSVYSLYKTCVTMKSIILMSGVIRVCDLSLNTMATAKSLQLDMIKGVAGQLYELNLCGVSDLSKSLLLPAITRMKCLKTLDVSYTKISILDLLDLHKTCPTITSISIDFHFSSERLDISNPVFDKCQEMLSNFINVHFVFRTSVFNLPLYLLRKSSLNTLKYTVCDLKGKFLPGVHIHDRIAFNHCCIFLLDCATTTVCQVSWQQLLPPCMMVATEFIIMEYNNSTYTTYTSTMFVRFFEENFNITPSCRLEASTKLFGNVAILIWNKKTTNFNELFYCNLKKRLKEILYCELKITSGQTLPLNVDTHSYEWFCITPIESIDSTSGYGKRQSNFKRRRIVPAGQVLDYDNIFKEHRRIKLRMNISLPGIVTLSTSSNYLKKLTYLNLAGTLVRYSSEFFNILFRCCENLITLNVEASSLSPCCSPIMRSISSSQTLKNIRIVDKRIDFKMLFSSFSQCKILENINVIDSSTEFNDLADPNTLYQMCTNLYSLSICAKIKISVEKKLQTLVKSLIKKNGTEHHIKISILNINPRSYMSEINHEPYLHAFNLKPIKPI